MDSGLPFALADPHRQCQGPTALVVNALLCTEGPVILAASSGPGGEVVLHGRYRNPGVLPLRARRSSGASCAAAQLGKPQPRHRHSSGASADRGFATCSNSSVRSSLRRSSITKFDYYLDAREFLSFILPSDFSSLDLIVGSTTFPKLISHGAKQYFFSADLELTGATDFSIADIKPLEDVDAADPTAFPTPLDFTPGAGPLTMKADLSKKATPSAQVPGQLSILGCSAVFSFSRRLRS